MFVEFEDIPVINGILPLHQALLSVVIAQDCRLSVLMLLLTAPAIVTNFARRQLDRFLYCSICGVQPTLLNHTPLQHCFCSMPVPVFLPVELVYEYSLLEM